MSCLDSTTIARLKARIAKIDEQLTALDTAYDEAISKFDVESYTFDSGMGRQTTKHRSPDDILKQIDRLEARRESLLNRLRGTGLLNINLSRRIRRGLRYGRY